MFARRRDLLEREAERIGALAVQGDLTIPQHLERLVTVTVDAFGGIDVLVLNGGGPPAGTAATLTAAAVEEAVALLLTSHVTLVGHCLPYLRAERPRAHRRDRVLVGAESRSRTSCSRTPCVPASWAG